MVLPESYIVQKFYQYAGRPKYNHLAKTYQGGCCICREGKSWGTKRRLFYVVDSNFIYCHNCGWSSSPLNWVKEVTNLSLREIYEEADDFDVIPKDISKTSNNFIKQLNVQDLPEDSINLFDINQLEYYKDNKFVQLAVNYICERKLNVAVNRPQSIYISLKDKIHKNRLILPFYDNNKIVHYQSRAINPVEHIKYLSKLNSDKSLFNIDNIKETINVIYVFEGPIDACFVENGIAVAGINEKSKHLFTHTQQIQLNRFSTYKKIIVLDSQWKDTTSRAKSKVLIDNGHTVFLWPKKFGTKFKDFNEMAIAADIKKIPLSLINENSFSDLKGLIELSRITG